MQLLNGVDRIYQKSLTECSVRDIGGEDEIRTRGTLETYVGLANRWFQPLTHLSNLTTLCQTGLQI